jgi:penicillin-binding protein A
VKSRLLVVALVAASSVALTGWSRISPPATPKLALQPQGPGAAHWHKDSEAVGAISLASITWDGTRASAQDSRGNRVQLTLDRTLQTASTQWLKTARPSRGAIVMLSAPEGRVLAIAEFPETVSHSQSLLWSANTPSASLFKLITTAALVERAQIQPDHRVCSEGGEHRLDARHLEAPKQGPIVCETFSEILASSRNSAYARLVHAHLVPEDLDNFADRFGFNSPLPADVPAELGRFHRADEPLAFARTATGFVGSSLSALGAAYLGLVIARGGVIGRLHLLEVVQDEPAGSGDASTPFGMDLDPPMSIARPDSPRPIRALEQNTANRLREMMEKVVSHGTAANAFRDETGRPVLPNLSIAGKTGTLGREERTASWFVGFAPSRDPSLVVAVLLDNGAVWHTTAKRVASALMQHYFNSHGTQLSHSR